ncbi:MAG TPA: hypothetical protein VHL80_15680 [Polyangia bacterium]|nr:hypothetical protein [Polyangia bacterium]
MQEHVARAERSSSVRSPMDVSGAQGSSPLAQNAQVREKLTALAARLEAIALRIRTIGLVRAAEDLSYVSAELRKLTSDDSERR